MNAELESIFKLGVEGVAICGLIYLLFVLIKILNASEIRNAQMQAKHIEALNSIVDKVKDNTTLLKDHHDWSIKSSEKRKCFAREMVKGNNLSAT